MKKFFKKAKIFIASGLIALFAFFPIGCGLDLMTIDPDNNPWQNILENLDWTEIINSIDWDEVMQHIDISQYITREQLREILGDDLMKKEDILEILATTSIFEWMNEAELRVFLERFLIANRQLIDQLIQDHLAEVDLASLFSLEDIENLLRQIDLSQFLSSEDIERILSQTDISQFLTKEQIRDILFSDGAGIFDYMNAADMVFFRLMILQLIEEMGLTSLLDEEELKKIMLEMIDQEEVLNLIIERMLESEEFFDKINEIIKEILRGQNPIDLDQIRQQIRADLLADPVIAAALALGQITNEFIDTLVEIMMRQQGHI